MLRQASKRMPESDIQHENRMLRGLLQSLGRDALHNQQAMARFQERELALLSAADLARLLERLTSGMRRSFELDSARLYLLDPFNVIRDLLATAVEEKAAFMRNVELCTDIRDTTEKFCDAQRPWLGAWDDGKHLALFRRRLGGSVALLPLRQADGVAGFLCLGSHDPKRFVHGQATDFLAHMASVAAICLENAVNRERLRLVGLTDSLTGLYNRRHLEHRLEQEVTRAQRYGHALSCMFVDADHFKQINDQHGHPVGDRVLSALAQRLRARLRTSDLATRYGGEEFAVLLPQTAADSAGALASEICRSVAAEPIMLDNGGMIPLTVSIGVAALANDRRQPAKDAGHLLLQRADEALYQAKQAGRNRVVCANPSPA